MTDPKQFISPRRADEIRDRLQQLGMPQERLAHYAGVDPSALSRYLSGVRRPPPGFEQSIERALSHMEQGRPPRHGLMLPQEVAASLRTRMSLAGVTMTRLASHLGVSRNTLSAQLHCHMPPPSGFQATISQAVDKLKAADDAAREAREKILNG